MGVSAVKHISGISLVIPFAFYRFFCADFFQSAKNKNGVGNGQGAIELAIHMTKTHPVSRRKRNKNPGGLGFVEIVPIVV